MRFSSTNTESQPRPHFLVLRAALLLFLLPLAGCLVGPDFSQPNLPILQQDFVANQQLRAYPTSELSQWWLAFGDPKLNALLARAQSQNLSLRESYERIVEARANLCLQGGSLRPNGNLSADYQYRKNSPNSRPFVGRNGDPFNFGSLGLDATWEIDLFGKIKRSIEAADAELKFQESEYEFIRQTLYADIVSSYLRVRLLQSQASLVEESLAVQGQTVILVSERMEAGVSTGLDQSQTEAFRHRTDALLASLRQQVELEFNQLGLLMGQTPDVMLRDFIGTLPVPAMPTIPEVGLPADLLRRRPDVWREEMAVRAASAQIGVAEADLYPQLTLLGTVAVSSRNLSGLFETNGLEFDVGPSVQWNILNGKRIQNNIAIQQARFRQSLARYQDTAIKAVRDVEDALINHQGYLEQWDAFRLAVDEDKNAVALSLQRYKAGKANFQRVLDAQQQLLDDHQQSIEAKTQAITQLVRLYKAAGGGWEGGGQSASFGGHSNGFAIETMPQQGMINYPPSVPSTLTDENVGFAMPENSNPNAGAMPNRSTTPKTRYLPPEVGFGPSTEPSGSGRYYLTPEIADPQSTPVIDETMEWDESDPIWLHEN